jgi:hypothetical protein
MIRARNAVLAVASALALGLAAPASSPARADDDGGTKVDTVDFELRLPAGWTVRKKADNVAHVASSIAVVACKDVQVFVTTGSGLSASNASEKKEIAEKPGFLGAAFIMPMALKAGSPAILVYDELVVGGEPTPAARVIATKGDESFTTFHGAVRLTAERTLSAAVVGRGKQGSAGDEPDGAEMQVVAQAYKIVREIKLKTR